MSAVRLMPWSHNVISSDTEDTASTYAAMAAYAGLPLANLTDGDPRKPAIWGGMMESAGNSADDIDFDEGGGEITASLGAVYHRNPQAMAGVVAAALNAAGGDTDYSCYWSQDPTNGRHVYTIAKGADTFTLPIATGTNAATNWLRYHGGFRAEDRAAAASHTGDYAVIDSDYNPAASIYDLGSAETDKRMRRAMVAINPRVSPLGCVRVDDTAWPEYDSEYIVQYADDFDAAPRVDVIAGHWAHQSAASVGAVYAGPYWSPGHNWTVSGYARTHRSNLQIDATIGGQMFLSELVAGESFTLSFTGPGLMPGDADSFAAMLLDLGVNDMLIVDMDPDVTPLEVRLCRVANGAELRRKSIHSKLGMVELTIGLEVVGL